MRSRSRFLGGLLGALLLGGGAPGWAATVAQDTFTEAVDTDLESHTPDVGTGWDTDGAASFQATDTDDLRASGTSIQAARETTTIGDDDMDVSIDYVVIRLSSDSRIGVIGRVPDTEDGEENSYQSYFIGDGSAVDITLDKVVASIRTNLGSYDANITSGDLPETMKLEIRTAAKKVYLNGIERISSSDDNLTGNNFAGVTGQRGVPRGDNYLSESVATAARRIWLLNRLPALLPDAHADDGRTVEWYVSDICGTGRTDAQGRVTPRHPCLVDIEHLGNWVLQAEADGKMYLRVLDTPAAHLLRRTDRTTDVLLPQAIREQIATRGMSRIDRR